MSAPYQSMEWTNNNENNQTWSIWDSGPNGISLHGGTEPSQSEHLSGSVL